MVMRGSQQCPYRAVWTPSEDGHPEANMPACCVSAEFSEALAKLQSVGSFE